MGSPSKLPSLVVLFAIMVVLPVPLNVRAATETILELPATDLPPTLPVANSTRSFWIDTPDANPYASKGSEGPLTLDADICIIGSGITGVSAAYHLGKALAGSNAAPLKTVILEARDFCSGATGRNGGHLAPHAFRYFQRSDTLWGKEEALKGLVLEQYTAAEIVKIIHEHKLEGAVDLVNGGRTELYFTEEEFTDAQADYEAAKAAGAHLEGVYWMSKEEVEAKYGTAYPATQLPGHNLWPLKFVTQLYDIAASSPNLNLTLHTRTPVTAIAPTTADARRWSLATPRGTIACSYVLHATNAYASHLLPQLRGPSGIVPTRGQVIALRAAADATKITRSAWLGNEGFEYWFPRPVGSAEERPLIILGGGREAGENFQFYEVDDSVTDDKVGAVLRDFLPSVFPDMFEAGREPEMEWTGIMGYTTSKDPFVGPVVDPSKADSAESYKGQYISAGYTGHGMPRAYAWRVLCSWTVIPLTRTLFMPALMYCSAEAVAGMIAADITGQQWSPPVWLPHHYITTA
ncbi:FAD dependent oxidoreductase [Amylocystis lapponica]|nr:FAD dependent oxidoreductase [Amylocystis lapponica]